MAKRRFELKDGKSNKFWEIQAYRGMQIVCYGKLGTDGRTVKNGFNSVEAAEASTDELIEQKISKGYSEVPARTRFVLKKSSRFWEIQIYRGQHIVRYGKLGTDGRTVKKDFDSVEAAEASCDKLIEQKISKGYSEVPATSESVPETGKKVGKPKVVVSDASNLAPKRTRLAALRKLGVPASICKLASKTKPAFFEFDCEEPLHIYSDVTIPNGPRIVPMWQCELDQTVAREGKQGIEYVTFSLESPERFRVVATSEQGLLAYVMCDPVRRRLEDAEYEASEGDKNAQKKANKELRAAANAVGFKHLKELCEIAMYDNVNKQLKFFRSLK